MPVPLHEANQPYNYQIDNVPLQALIDRILLVNAQVDVDAIILSDAQGTQGTLSNRLAQSLNPDGSLKTSAIDAAQHNIAEHTDGYITVDDVPISYVRMLYAERAKLSNIASDATSLRVLVNVTPSIPSGLPSQISVISISQIEYDNEPLEIEASDSIYWSVDAQGKISANTTFPSSVRHVHYYDIVPVHANLLSPDYINYKVTSTATAYKSGNLRVYLNGVRLTESSNITPGKAPRANYVPTEFGDDGPTWVTYTYTEGDEEDGIVTGGDFSLSAAITSDDVITIDFDILYTG